MFDWLGDILGLNKGKATIDAAAQNSTVLTNLGNQQNSVIDAGDAQQRGYLEQILGLTGMGNGSTLYADALGVNGADGSTRAQDAFKTSPGFDFNMNTGLQALDRRRAASGGFSSGGADLDTLTYSQGLASQDWNNWLGNLTGGVDRASGALGDLATQAGGTMATRLGLNDSLASGRLNVNNQTAAGKEAGQGSAWDFLGNVAGVAGAAFGLPKMPGGGGMPATPTGAGWGGYGRGY